MSLPKKSQEFEAFNVFQSTIVEAQDFKTRRLRMNISGEQTSKKMIDYLVSKVSANNLFHTPIRPLQTRQKGKFRPFSDEC